MTTARVVMIGAPTVAEKQLVLTVRFGPNAGALVDQFLSEIQALIVPFGRDHVSTFQDSFARYGKGCHPARLNMGDCFSYAVAKIAGMPVLFIGNDFSLTDLKLA